MSLQNKIGFDQEGVSPVVGVILMVAITVILAAVIGTFVLGLGDQVNQNAQAGVTFDEDVGNEVTIQLNSVQAADYIYVETETDYTAGAGGVASGSYTDAAGDVNSNNAFLLSDAGGGVGQTVDVTTANSAYVVDEQITVIGVLEGEENIIQTYTMG